MALCKYEQIVKHSDHEAFDTLHSPGDNTPHSGIYRCEGCAKEVASNANNPLPPQNHHQHASTQGKIQWRMLVYAETS
jgi:hypothetical protein